MSVTSTELAKVAAMAADKKKATDIVMLDLRSISDVCDYFVIATAANRRMADSIIDEIEEKVRVNCDEKPYSIEGRESSHWILMDYGSVVVHVFDYETRKFYRLEHLWGDAQRVLLDLEGAADTKAE
ncbi:MAG: ribosome silencing factor [Coriobacteriaceae bacterium]|nr:MAG: ribosome silencing factor [Coriobacteriaceae bacterium]